MFAFFICEAKKGGIKIKDISIKILGIGSGGCAIVTQMMNTPLPEVEYLGFDMEKGSVFPFTKQKSKQNAKHQKRKQKIQLNRNPQINKRKVLQQLQAQDLLILCADFTEKHAEHGISMITSLIESCSFLKLAFVIPSHNAKSQEHDISKHWMQALDATFQLSQEQIQYHLEKHQPTQAHIVARNLIEQGVCALYELMSVPTYINVDFADIVTTLQKQGRGFIGIGQGKGQGKVTQAIDQALQRDLHQHPMRGAHHAIIHVCVGENLYLAEVKEVMQHIQMEAQNELDIIFGMMVKEAMEDEIIVTVLASGYHEDHK